MPEVLAHAWFEGYESPHVFSPDEYEDEEMTVVRALTRAPRRGKKGRKRTLGRALNINLATVLEEEDPPHVLAAASTSYGARRGRGYDAVDANEECEVSNDPTTIGAYQWPYREGKLWIYCGLEHALGGLF